MCRISLWRLIAKIKTLYKSIAVVIFATTANFFSFLHSAEFNIAFF